MRKKSYHGDMVEKTATRARGSAVLATLILAAASVVAGSIVYVFHNDQVLSSLIPSAEAATTEMPQATHAKCDPGTWITISGSSYGTPSVITCFYHPSDSSMDDCSSNSGCTKIQRAVDIESQRGLAETFGFGDIVDKVLKTLKASHSDRLVCECSNGARAWRVSSFELCAKMSLTDFVKKNRCIETMNLPDGKSINCVIDNGQVHGLTSSDEASCTHAGPPKVSSGPDRTPQGGVADPCAVMTDPTAHQDCVKQQQSCTGGTAVGCQPENPTPDTPKQTTRVPDGTSCDPACTGSQVCVGKSCVDSSTQTTYPPTQTQTQISCPDGTYGAYPNCQTIQTQGIQGQTGGLTQSPYQPTQQQQQNQIYCPVSSMQNTYIQQSYPCAQNVNQYTQLQQTAQNDYINQVNQYNSCVSQQTSQCPSQCQQPYQQQIQMCQNTQSSPYGIGNDGNPCQMPPAQPDASQCTNGYWQRQSQTGNGCTTGWQCVSNNSCQSSPSQPDASGCTSGVWQPLYQPGNSNACVSGWQCTTNAQAHVAASLSCLGPNNTNSIAPGQALTLAWTCQGADSATIDGFSTGNQVSGTTTIVQAVPPSGNSLATYTLSCANSTTGNTAGAQCAVNIVNPKIVLAAVPGSVSAGSTSSIGWVTTGMQACTISSPNLPDFTAANANNTNTNGAVVTPSLSSTVPFMLTCTSLDGQTVVASTTVTVR